MNRPPADRFRPRWEEVEIRSHLASIARRYPEPLVESQLGSIDRVAFELEIVLRNAPGARTLCDLGAGIGMFPIACAALGMRAILVDDFQDPVCFEHGQPTLELHKRYGVEVLMRDLVEEGLDLPPETIDVFTIFDSMEHWHHSPKPVFGAVMRALRPGGLFVLSGPNCANLRKRITLLFGRGKWSAMHDWYDAPRFRGHVREPDVEDLRYIARDGDLSQVRILGRNWAGWGFAAAADSNHYTFRGFDAAVETLALLGSLPDWKQTGLSLSVCAPINHAHGSRMYPPLIYR